MDDCGVPVSLFFFPSADNAGGLTFPQHNIYRDAHAPTSRSPLARSVPSRSAPTSRSTVVAGFPSPRTHGRLQSRAVEPVAAHVHRPVGGDREEALVEHRGAGDERWGSGERVRCVLEREAYLARAPVGRAQRVVRGVRSPGGLR